MIIQFEGTDGVGKTTLSTELVQFLKKEGKTVFYVHYPLEQNKKRLVNKEFISDDVKDMYFMTEIIENRYKYPNADFIIEDRGLLSTYVYGSNKTKNIVAKAIEQYERETILILLDYIYDENKRENYIDENKFLHREIYRELYWNGFLIKNYREVLFYSYPTNVYSLINDLLKYFR